MQQADAKQQTKAFKHEALQLQGACAPPVQAVQNQAKYCLVGSRAHF